MRRKTIQVLTSDVNVTLHQTNDLLAKVNVLTDDLNQKVATIDPLLQPWRIFQSLFQI